MAGPAKIATGWSSPYAVKPFVDQTNVQSAECGRNGHESNCFHAQLRSLVRSRRNLHLTVAWVPGHKGIHGNEMVDAEAKLAALGLTSPSFATIKELERPLPLSKAAVIASKHKEVHRQWKEEWEASSAGFSRSWTLTHRYPNSSELCTTTSCGPHAMYSHSCVLHA